MPSCSRVQECNLALGFVVASAQGEIAPSPYGE